MDGRRPDPRRAHHTVEEPSPWEQQVYADYIAGETHRQLAERHECSHKHIQNVCKRVIGWLCPQMREMIKEATQELIDQHKNAYHEAMAAWKKSIGQVVKETVTKQTGRVDRRGNPLGDEVKTERRYSSDDPRHLNTAIKALQEYRKIIGYVAPFAQRRQRPPSGWEGL